VTGAITGMLTGSTVLDGAGVERFVGYRNIPITAKTAAYQITLSDVGQGISITTGGITIPVIATTAFAIGDSVVIYNNSASSQTITGAGSLVLRLAGTATTGSRTLAQRGRMHLTQSRSRRMGFQRNGADMSGIGMALAAGVDAGGSPTPPPPASLSISINWGGGNPQSVSGASGTTGSSFTYSVSGGTPPYAIGTSTTVNTSGKLGVTGPSNPSGSGTFKATWSGLAVNETQNAYFQASVTDSASNYSSATYPNLGIKRTS
jgi:hypothetical protein